MTGLPYRMRPPDGPILGLVVLQADQTIEGEFRRLLPAGAELYVSRVPSGAEVTPETLAKMKGHLAHAAALLPPQVAYDVVGYGCTSGTAEIGAGEIARQVQHGAQAAQVTEPVSALIAACRSLGVRRLALLSPYVQAVSDRLRGVLAEHGIETPVFASFDEAEEARVVRIDTGSIRRGAEAMMAGQRADALFLSCTNLRTLDVIAPLDAQLRVPVLSSNLVLAWHMAQLAGLPLAPGFPGRLAQVARLPG